MLSVTLRLMSRLTICAVAAVLVGCGGSSATPKPIPTAAHQTVIQPGAPGEPSREVVATPTPAGSGAKAVDVEFMKGMIHHHQQAVQMADWVPERTQSTSIKLMAQRMSVSQQDEMLLMRTWLEKHGADADDHAHMSDAMPGMLSASQLKKLEGARGRAFDRLFLRYMTQHHMGALTMVQNLVDDGGGVESEIEQFILHVDSDQSIEIQRMQELLSDF
jgi:uncharacterized protein (DUF305 family)